MVAILAKFIKSFVIRLVGKNKKASRTDKIRLAFFSGADKGI